MRRRLLLASVILAVSALADTGPDAEVGAVHHLVDEYVQAVDTVDPKLLAQVWSHSRDVSFIYPLGEEHGFNAIQQHVFQGVMGTMFAKRDLEARDISVHVDGDSGWSEFHWTFHATLRKDGSEITTRGVETQIYRKEGGSWHIVHVHYSADPQPAR